MALPAPCGIAFKTVQIAWEVVSVWVKLRVIKGVFEVMFIGNVLSVWVIIKGNFLMDFGKRFYHLLCV